MTLFFSPKKGVNDDMKYKDPFKATNFHLDNFTF